MHVHIYICYIQIALRGLKPVYLYFTTPIPLYLYSNEDIRLFVYCKTPKSKHLTNLISQVHIREIDHGHIS